MALMHGDWHVVPEAIQIGRRAFRTIKQNLWFAAVYNLVGMLLAATGWLPAFADAVFDGEAVLDQVRAIRADTLEGAMLALGHRGAVPVYVGRGGRCWRHCGTSCSSTHGCGSTAPRRSTSGTLT